MYAASLLEEKSSWNASIKFLYHFISKQKLRFFYNQ